jgi:flavin reductase (DIM6/NTAB) family NADH-FMN oxidoreductase RutF
MHISLEPGILYFGTPVVLISTLNEDGSNNLAPMSSAFWLGWRCLLGLAAVSKTPQNMIRTGECVLNLPSVAEVDAVDRLALTTGSDPVPEGKVRRGYQFERDKFEIAQLTPVPSETVAPPRVLQCPVQLEAKVECVHPVAAGDPQQSGRIQCIEVRVTRVHVDQAIVKKDAPNHIDPDLWRPLIMSFQRFYGLGREVRNSRLATIPEAMYRGPDTDRARHEAMRHQSVGHPRNIARVLPDRIEA